MSERDGGPAFPPQDRVLVCSAPLDAEALNSIKDALTRDVHKGMSLRDYFAGQALTGILACPVDYRGNESLIERVVLAYKYADAMLKAREK